MITKYIDFYSQHVEDLKKEGSQYLGWCPFHNDQGSKMKGFSVNPDNGLWKCFSGCDAGNAVSFCQKKGLDVKQAPDHDPGYNRYSYGGGISKMKPKPELKAKGKNEFWDGTDKKGLPDNMKPFNHQAIELARKLNKTLWICEGEKDALTMWAAGEPAIGIPSASTYKVLDNVSLDGIAEVVIAMDNDDAGRKATDVIKDKFPSAKVVIWPPAYPKGWDVTDLMGDFDGDSGLFIGQLKQYVRKDIWADEAEKVDDFLDQIRAGTSYIKTGFAQLDEYLDGLLPGGLHVIQGSSSIGKTTFCKQLADQVHEKQPELPIFFFALEDSLQTVRCMTYSRLSFEDDPKTAIENRLIRKGGKALLDDQYEILQALAPRVKEIYGNDYYLVAGEPNINVRTIRERIERKLHRINKQSAMVIVDYLQILPTPKEERLGSLMDKIDFNLHELQCLARDINGPVILTSSTTKEDIKETEKKKAPGLVKGKGSANILYTPRMLIELIQIEDTQEYAVVELHILKNSEGPKNKTISFNYHYKYSAFWQAV